MANATERSEAIDQFRRFLERDPADRQRIVIVRARSGEGLSTTLAEVGRLTGAPGQILDDAQRRPDLCQRIRGGAPRMIVGEDLDDAEDLRAHVRAQLKQLTDADLVALKKLALAPLNEDEMSAQILKRLPGTRAAVATALAARLGGRIALLDHVLDLPDVRVRTRENRLCMTPDQIGTLTCTPEALMQQRWLGLPPPARRITLAVAATDGATCDALPDMCRRLGVDPETAPDQAESWIDIRGSHVFPAKGVRRFASLLQARQAPVALEVRAALGARDQGKPNAVRPRPHPTEKPMPAARGNPRPEPQPNPAADTVPPTRPEAQVPAVEPQKPPPPRPATEPRRSSAEIRRELSQHQATRFQTKAAQKLLRDLVAAYRRERRTKDAATAQRVLVKALADALGGQHPRAATAALELGELEAAADDARARGTFDLAIRVLSRHYGPSSPKVAKARARKRNAGPRRI